MLEADYAFFTFLNFGP